MTALTLKKRASSIRYEKRKAKNSETERKEKEKQTKTDRMELTKKHH